MNDSKVTSWTTFPQRHTSRAFYDFPGSINVVPTPRAATHPRNLDRYTTQDPCY